MWLVEIPLPFLAFIPGWPRIIAALGIVALMLGIWAGGNYGFFNLLTGASIPISKYLTPYCDYWLIAPADVVLRVIRQASAHFPGISPPMILSMILSCRCGGDHLLRPQRQCAH